MNVREPIPPKEIASYILGTSFFFERLEKIALERDEVFQDEVKQESDNVPPRFKGLAVSIYATQKAAMLKQLFKIIKKRPDYTDKVILAEAVYLKEYYSAEGNPTEIKICEYFPTSF